jgi:poly[(R)-3-hydroxyalkanoate] polymerase subunit PhaC
MTMILWVPATLLSLFLAGLLLRRAHRLPTPADERHFASTDDGWLLALYRYLPEGARASGRPAPESGSPGHPVVICHGLLSNRFNLDLDENHSLARHLRRAGFDVWVMELRGHGASRRAATGGLRPFDWTIDHYVRRDFPAVVAYVRRATGAETIHWVGHSLGGMILYAACALGITGPIRSAVMGDVPTNFAHDRKPGWFGKAYVRLIPAVPPALVIPFTLLVALISPSLFLPRYGIHDRATMLRIVSNGIIDWGCSKVAHHLIDVVMNGRFASADGRIDYEEGVRLIHFPVLQLAAPSRRSPEAVVRALIDWAPVADKTYLRLGRSEGFGEDYNHFTIFLGERSRHEVFPVVERFLRRHDA